MRYLSYNCNQETTQLIHSNLFVQFNPVYSIEELLKTIGADTTIHLNHVLPEQYKSVVDFVQDGVVANEELLGNKCKYKTYKKRYLVSFEFLLNNAKDDVISNDINYTKTLSNLLVDVIFKKLKSPLPYFSLIQKRGKGIYLTIYIYERYYIENGEMRTITSKSDRYRNSVTGQCCKSTDKHALLFMHAGDIISSTLSHYSNKVSSFAFKSKSIFNALIEHLKIALFDFTVRLNKKMDTLRKGYSFKRLTRKQFNLNPFKASTLQTTMKRMESLIEHEYEILTSCKIESSEQCVSDIMHPFFLRYSNILRGDSFYADDNKKVKISLSFDLSYRMYKCNCTMLLNKFSNDLSQVMRDVFANN